MIDSGDVHTVGKYELVELLGSGGMAEVWRATVRGAAGFRKDVALKMIRREWADEAQFVTMFVDEACLGAKLTHPNIVATYDFGRAGGRYYIAMEMVDGATLRSIVRHLEASGRRLDQALALHVIAEVAAGLDYAHQATDAQGRPLHIIHRDVNPANVLVSLHGEVKLSDFGIAKAAGRAAVTEAGSLKGKIPYMSPEQAWGRPLDARSDVYALGLMLQELLTGRRAIDGENEIQMLERARAAQVAPLGTEVSPELAAILGRALALHPEMRYPSAAALRRDLQERLEALLRERTEAARRPRPRRTLVFGVVRPEEPAAPDAAAGAAAADVAPPLDPAAALGELASEVERKRLSGMMPAVSATAATLGTEVATGQRPAPRPTPATLAESAAAAEDLSTEELEPPRASWARPLVRAAAGLGLMASLAAIIVGVGSWRAAAGTAAARGGAQAARGARPERAQGEREGTPAALVHAPAPGPATTPVLPRPSPVSAAPARTHGTHRTAPRTEPAPAALREPAEVAMGGEHGTLRIQVAPWAEVWLDGRSIGLTPLRPLEAPPGPHTIIARHPTLGERRTQVMLPAGEVRLIRLDLNAKP